jgi:hypothetical protein
MKNILSLFVLILLNQSIQAQTASEIITKLQETIGGKKWEAVNGIKMTAKVDAGGMKIPLELVMLKDGRMYSKITFQGQEMIQGAFDGETSWGTNFMTQKAEKSPADDNENTKRASKEFPNALVNYQKLGYTPTLMTDETIDGVLCYKIKLDKKTQLVEGKEVPNIEYYYIDKENNVIIQTESEINSGEMKGKMAQTKYSDYQEVNGVYFAFSQKSGIKDGPSQALTFDKIETNPVVDEKIFKYPGQ